MAEKIHGLLTPDNFTLLLVDYQPQMAFAVHSIDGQTLINNAVGLAKSAKLFKVPTILTTVAEKSFSGPMFPQLADVFPGEKPIDRTTMNLWEDNNVRKAIDKIGRKKILLAGLWTEICIALPTIQALEAGYEVYFVADACGDVTSDAHEMAVQRMIQAGAVPMTWLQVMLELQRDWARTGTYHGVMDIAKEHAGAYGIGIVYAGFALGKEAKKAA
jgi:nicotinamidase-related amidase